MIPVVGFGAGGHGKVVIEILRAMREYEVVGLLERKPELRGTRVLGVEVLGDDDLMAQLKQRGVNHAFIGLGTIGDTRLRRQLYEKVSGFGFLIVRAIHPTAVIAESANIGVGPTIMAGAIVNADASIGSNVIINTGAIVEHDCMIGDHSHIATGARLAGAVEIGAGSHIGLGAMIRQGIRVGEGALVGAGAVVVKDVPAWTTVIGVPAKIFGAD